MIYKFFNIFFICIFFFFSGCDLEGNAHKLPLKVDIKNNNVCLYTDNKRSFLDMNDPSAYFLIYAGISNPEIKKATFEQTILIKNHQFPFTKEKCFLISLDLFDLNKPYDFILDTDKTFDERACILKTKGGYEIKKVYSTENCDS